MPKPLILMYHRVCDLEGADPWQLAVSPSRFDQHLSVLRHLCEPLAMAEFVERLDRGTLPSNAVGVTFDDGYADNLINAKPSLVRAGIPATVFIVTGSVGKPEEFWWDELARLILQSGDIDCEMLIAGKPRRLAFAGAPPDSPLLPRWKDWRCPRTARESAYLEIWTRLQSLPTNERDSAMSSLRKAVKAGAVPAENLPMTADEVNELVADGLIDVGAHSIKHPLLTALSPEESWHEIAVGKDECEKLTGRRVYAFAYPHGAFDSSARAMVRDAGFRFACATKDIVVNVECFDHFALPRLQVKNWTGEAFERFLTRVYDQRGA